MDCVCYSDASFDDKKGIAGWGVILKKGEKQRVYSNWIKASSINEAELFAIYMASILLEGKGVIYTDSLTAISYINREIKDKPRTTEQYIRHKHCELWAYKIRKNPNITVEKVKGHQRSIQSHFICNQFADLASRSGRAKFYER